MSNSGPMVGCLRLKAREDSHLQKSTLTSLRARRNRTCRYTNSASSILSAQPDHEYEVSPTLTFHAELILAAKVDNHSAKAVLP